MRRGIGAAGDVINTTIDGVSTNAIWAEADAALNILNTSRDSLRSQLCFPTTASAEDVLQAFVGAEFEDASEYGEPNGYRSTPSFVRLGFPLVWRDLARRTTWRYLIEASAEQIRNDTNTAIEADNRQVFKAVMAALFDPAQRLNEDGVPIVPLYNGDGFVPPTYNGIEYTGAETHYITTGSVGLDAADLAALIGKPRGKGYGDGAGRGQLLVFANPQEIDVIRTFRAAGGAGAFDFIPSVSAPAYLTAEQIIGATAPATYGSVPIVGSYGPAWISENSLIPKGYVLAVVSGGANSAQNPVAFREHVRPELRGLRQIKGSSATYPLQDSFFARGFGTGVRHRGAAAVLQVTAAGTYTAPAAYKHGA